MARVSRKSVLALAGMVLGASTLAAPFAIAQSGASECRYPAEVLDLSSWKVQLPTGDDEKPDEVKQPDLSEFAVDPWFVPTAECDGVRFRAAVDGTTTSGSSYPRSELREMAGEDGDQKAAWSTTEGTHVLTVEMAFTQLPDGKPHMVGAQIHGGDDDLTVIRLEGSKLYVTNGDNAHHHLITDDYELGTWFEAKFVAGDGEVKAYYDGQLQTTIEAEDDDAYFKTGAYTQANCDNADPCSPDNYGEAVLRALTVDHGETEPSDPASPTSSPTGSPTSSPTASPTDPPACTVHAESVEDAQAAEPGDVVCFDGDFSDTRLEVTKGGTAEQPVTYAGNGQQVAGITIEADHVIVDGYTMTEPEAPGVWMEGNGITLQNTTITRPVDGDGDGIRFFGNDLNILNNTISETSNEHGHADCMQTYSSDSPPSQRVLIEGNRCEQIDNMCLMAEGPNDGEGDGEGHTTDVVIRNNFCETLEASQTIMIEDIQDVRIFDNEFAGPTHHSIGLAINSTGAHVNGNQVHPDTQYEVGIDDSSREGYQGPEPGGEP